LHPRIRLTIVGAVIVALTLGLASVIAFAVRPAARADDPVDASRSHSPFKGSLMPPGIRAPDFSLTDEQGRPISMRAFRGKPVVVAFAYTTCEDTCPLEVQQVRGAVDDLAGDGHDIPAIVVAVDPPRDTPERARQFLREQRVFGQVRFVLGSRQQLAPVWKGFAVQPQEEEVEHQARVTLVDGAGFQRVGYFAGYLTPDDLAHDVKVLLEEQATG
jgi:protein SCO1/2